MSTLKTTIQQLVADDQTETAIQQLAEATALSNPRLHRRVVLLSAEHERIQEIQTAGIESHEEIGRSFNSLNLKLLKLLEDLDKKPLPAILPALSTTFNTTATVIGAALLIVAGVIWGIVALFNSCEAAASRPPAPAAAPIFFDKVVDSLYYEVATHLYLDYQNAYLGSPSHDQRIKLLDDANKIADQLREIPPQQLSAIARVERSLGLMVVYKIRGLMTNENDRDKKIEYAEKSIRYGNEAQDNIKLIESLPPAEQQAARQWVIEEQHALRIEINNFIAKCAICMAGSTCEVELLKTKFEGMKVQLQEYNYLNYPVLRQMQERYTGKFDF